MNADAYFSLMDAIAAARTSEEFALLRARLVATDMAPIERRALQRQMRYRELALDLDSGRGPGHRSHPTDERRHER